MLRNQAPAFDEGAIQEVKRLIGLRMRRHSKSLSVTADWIRHYAHSIGDDNPLFCDEAYARTTKWKNAIAPPTFLYLVDSTIVAPGLRGIQWVYGGTDWEWFIPVFPGDNIRASVRMVDVIERKGRHAARMIEQVGEVLYWNQKDEVVARALGRTLRIPRMKASSGGMKYETRLQKHSLDELKALDYFYENEFVRGEEFLLWEDVREGEELPAIHKGPLRSAEIALIGFQSTGEGENTAFQGAHAYQWLHRLKYPDDVYSDPDTGVDDVPHRGHWEPYMAREAGMPGVYDVGFQRISWIAQLMTNWMGDEGRLVQLSVTLRKPNVVGDVTWLGGRIKEKEYREGIPVVRCEVWAKNQLNEITAEGRATVRLPSKK